VLRASFFVEGWPSTAGMPSPLPRRDRRRTAALPVQPGFIARRFQPSPYLRWVGSRIICFEACSAFTRVTACLLARSPKVTLYTGDSGGFVASTAAPIATGWSDQLPGGYYPH
jgi:hypothetical protein